MKIILLERIPKLGRIGDVVSVRDGYARNFLLPRQRALRATVANISYFEAKREEIEAQNLKRHAAAEEVAEALEGRVITSIQQAGESGQLYGSVSAREIARLLGEQGISIHHNQVILYNPIKNLGLHSATVNLHGDISAAIQVNAARNKEEAEHQLSAAKAKMERATKIVTDATETRPEADSAANKKVEASSSGKSDDREQASSVDTEENQVA